MGTTTQPAPSAWQHAALFFGSACAIVIGAGDAYLRQKFGIGVDVGLVLGGLAGFGVQTSGILPH
jgi:hypothetical protein